jgi:hypothetical protein
LSDHPELAIETARVRRSAIYAWRG